MPKRVDYDKNPQSAEAERKKRQAITQSPERRMAQLRYRLNSIDQSVAAGRQKFEDVEPEVKRLRSQLDALETSNG